MSPQLSAQQLEHAISNLEKRVSAKKLECASIDHMRKQFPMLITRALNLQDDPAQHYHPGQTTIPVQDSVYNYLTAKLNQALIDLEELELTLRAYKQASSGIVGARLMPPSNSKMH